MEARDFLVEEAVAEYRRLETLLTNEIEGRQDEVTIRTLDQRLEKLRDRISIMEPLNTSQSLAQVLFFLQLAERWGEPSADMEIAKRLLTNRLQFSPLANSQSRISMINTDFRYEATTRGNRNFYHLNEHEIIGLHVGEVIGKARFEGRARKFLETTFSGKKQMYYHSLQTEEGERIMRCVMEPCRNESGGALVSMCDVTNELADPKNICLTDLKPAA